MVYYRRVVKRRPASLTDAEWLQVVERGKLPRPALEVKDDFHYPPVDVHDMLLQAGLNDLRVRLGVLCMALSKPSVAGSTQDSSLSSLSPGQLLSSFSEIWEFLTKLSYQDGSPRHSGKVSLACSSAGLQVTLTDPSSNCYCCVTKNSLDDAFLALEVGLKEGTLAWRASSYTPGKRK